MHTYSLLILFVVSTLGAASQKLAQVTFGQGGDFSYFSIATDQDILIRVSAEGNILEWGTEVQGYYGNYYAPRLQPFMGRVEYYGAEADSSFRGKVKSIGTCYLTYYGDYEEKYKRGKLKGMNLLQFDYYSHFDEKALQGRLRWIGALALDYYRSYEDEAVRGKLKSIGPLPVTYYTVFEDKFNAGKLKSIGTTPYHWYSQYDQGRGALKSNSYRQFVGGILVVLQ